MRHMLAVSSAAALALITGAPASAQAAQNQTAAKEADSEDNRIRCRKIEVTGSLVRKAKVCRTVAEWRQISDKGNRNVRDIAESGNVCAGGPICNSQ